MCESECIATEWVGRTQNFEHTWSVIEFNRMTYFIFENQFNCERMAPTRNAYTSSENESYHFNVWFYLFASICAQLQNIVARIGYHKHHTILIETETKYSKPCDRQTQLSNKHGTIFELIFCMYFQMHRSRWYVCALYGLLNRIYAINWFWNDSDWGFCERNGMGCSRGHNV